MATLRSQMVADIASVFHNTEDFAEEIDHYRGPNMSVAETVTAVVDYDALDAAQGRDLTNEFGTKIKSRAILRGLLASVDVEEEKPGAQFPSVFEIYERDEDGAKTGPSWLWVAKRIISKDHAAQEVEIHRLDRKATRRIEPR